VYLIFIFLLYGHIKKDMGGALNANAAKEGLYGNSSASSLNVGRIHREEACCAERIQKDSSS
jgi:hypothetical protein